MLENLHGGVLLLVERFYYANSSSLVISLHAVTDELRD